MVAKEFKKLLKEKEPKKIIYEYVDAKYNLTDKQLQQVLDLKNSKERNFKQ